MSRIHDALRIAEQTDAAGVPKIAVNDQAELVTVSSAATPTGHPAGANALMDAVRSIGSTDASVVPVIGEGLVSRQENWHPDRRSMVDFASDYSSGAEQFRTLRSRLNQIRAHRALRTLLVTSALPGEGKSFVATNLARSIAYQPGNRVLLIDCDLRRPRLQHFLGAPASPGLSEYLAGSVSETQIVQQSANSSLFLIPAGVTKMNAAELLTSPQLETLLQRCAASFDWVILDSPPALAVSDSSVLSNFCDGVLMVVVAGQTPISAVSKAMEEFAQESMVGVVLNRSEAVSETAVYYGTERKVARKKR